MSQNFNISWNNMEDFFKDNSHYMMKGHLLQKYKIQFINRNKGYELPKSNNQIQTILRSKFKSSIYYRLSELFTQSIKSTNYYEFLFYLFKNYKKTDIETFKYIHPFVKKIREYDNTDIFNSYSINLADSRIYQLETAGVNISSIKNYLDFGCGDCSFAASMGKQLGLEKKNIYGTDIEDVFEVEWSKRQQDNPYVNFKYISDGIIPFDIKFDLITCHMVLHHISDNDINITINNIYNSLNTDGYLLIKEHDCIDAIDRMIIDLQHSFYTIRGVKNSNDLDKSSKISNKILNQKNFYKDKYQWDYIMSSHGFKSVLQSNLTLGLRADEAISKNYIAIYKKF